jgi:hypothetical protein
MTIIADALSRFRVPVKTEWELHPVIFQAITLIWDRPLIDLFATSLNYKLETFVSLLSYLVQNPVEKTKWWEDVIEHLFPGVIASTAQAFWSGIGDTNVSSL